jgi:hypothetical protein
VPRQKRIAFLSTRRFELNAMTSRQLVDFVETELTEHDVHKLIPDDNVIEQHARVVIKELLIAKISDEFDKDASKGRFTLADRGTPQKKSRATVGRGGRTGHCRRRRRAMKALEAALSYAARDWRVFPARD